MGKLYITDHFAAYEFAQPSRKGQPEIPYPEEWIYGRLLPLCQVLEVIRDTMGGHSITILSGYRSPAYNKLLPGAAKNSQHMQGKAADIVIPGFASGDIHDVVLALHRDGKIRIGGLGLYPGFIHVDIRDGSKLARWTGSRTVSAHAS